MRAILATILTLCCILAIGEGNAAQKGDGRGAIATSTLDDQTAVSLTIYNVNLGLVKDQRQVKLEKGMGDLRFMDVASQIIPMSVQIRSIADPASLHILEQNYEYDLLSPQKLLDKYIGREVKLVTTNPYTEREEIVTATLLSTNNQPVYRIGNEITFDHHGRIVFPSVPEDLNARPTLVWILENRLSSAQKLEATYLTNGINWRSDYVVTLNAVDDRADLSGWVTIDNRSGASYKNATLKLVAGDVNRVREMPAYAEDSHALSLSRMKVAAAPQFKEESFFEYHIYALDRPATVKDNQSKQISLVTAEGIPVRKEFLFMGANYYYQSRYNDVMPNQKASVFIEFTNKQENNLGIPLPKGTVRVYKADTEGSLQFVGEDAIDHTPKDEKIRIRLGDAFDVVGSRKQTDWKKTASDTYEAEFEILLRNHKKEDVVVRVVEPVPGDWTLLKSTHAHKKTEAFTAEFQIPVPKDQEVRLSYRVRMRY